jgi:hypothetical protein
LRKKRIKTQVIEEMITGRIEPTGRRGRRHRRLLNDVKKNIRYWELEEEALDRTVWRTRCGRGCATVLRQTAG